MPARDRDDVLARAAQLDADDVGVGVDAEEPRHEDVLEQVADRRRRSAATTVADGMPRLTSSAWLGPERPASALAAAEHVLEHLGHEHERAVLDALATG